jgi:hypothetical protein
MLAILCQIACYAAKRKADKPVVSFERNIFSISMTNAVSYGFYDGVNGPTERTIIEQHPASGFNNIIFSKPSYSFAVSLKYDYGISKLWRLETGIGYLLQGRTMRSGTQQLTPPYQVTTDFYQSYYYGYICVPIHAVMTKQIGRGCLTVALGPDFNMPVNSRIVLDNPNIPLRRKVFNDRYKTPATAANSSMGVYLKVGYAIPVSQTISADIGPAINFNNVALFHRDPSQPNFSLINSRQIFNYYIGLDVAFNFGFTVITLRSKPRYRS